MSHCESPLSLWLETLPNQGVDSERFQLMSASFPRKLGLETLPNSVALLLLMKLLVKTRLRVRNRFAGRGLSTIAPAFAGATS
jgi:hypothetical protein